MLDTLKDIHAKLTNFEARRSNDEANLEEDQIKFAKLFVQYGGEDVRERIKSQGKNSILNLR